MHADEQVVWDIPSTEESGLTRQQVLQTFPEGVSIKPVSRQQPAANSGSLGERQVPSGPPFGAPDIRIKHRGTRPGQARRHPRVISFSWNVGGLSVEKLDNLLSWFLLKRVQVATLQETRWTFDSEWRSGPFVLIHSGGSAQDRFCGVLVVIHTSLVPSHGVRHTCLLPGRLLHVRLNHPKTSQAIDILNGYQFYLGTPSENEYREERQAHFLDKLGQTLAGLPRRNLLLIVGDFNMELPTTNPWLGTSCVADNQSLTPVQEQFLQLVSSYDLCAVNSWGSRSSFTCTGPRGGASFIDYVFLRKEHADAESKKTQILYSHPHATGSVAYHCPMLFSWSLGWLPWKQTCSGKTSFGRLALSAASVEAQARCEHSMAQALEEVGRLEEVPLRVWEVAARFHQVNRSEKKLPVWQLPSSRHKTSHVWQLWRELASPSGNSCRALFRRWSILTSLMKARRAQHKHSRQQRRRRMQELFDRAQTAATKGDRRELHKLVRLLSPKMPKKHLRLRHDDGRLMDTAAEVDAIKRQLQQQFASTPSTLHLSDWKVSVMPFSSEDLVCALKNLCTFWIYAH